MVVQQVSITPLLVCLIQMASFSPIVGAPQNSVLSLDAGFNPNQRSETEEFIRTNGVSGEEIQEYNRLSKCIGLWLHK